ncbi:hypothetical protein [Edaphobacter albus]|uniref:hypothetical protein n=1 Tax=Edaphobacter sp. 4G125 TaxID=2763071 RepID=UPI0016479943|nr:hypothetical protein [Edaphobacter sp. 4G125]QNI36488.1 hypothetical protein H7846_16245 [Edaphobacter sp. 4G125]
MAESNGLLSAEEIAEIKQRALRAISPLEPPSRGKNYRVGDKRTEAGKNLPEYYLVYFLLVELLGFPRGGRWEKTAWSIPVDFEGNLAFVEHRKFGLGIFSPGEPDDEVVAQQIVASINRGVRTAKEFFNHLAWQAVEQSQLNVTNTSRWLFDRYRYIYDRFREKSEEAERRKEEVITTRNEHSNGSHSTMYSRPSFQLRREATWFGLSAIEAFFSWTEHVLVHVAVLRGNIKTGQEVADLARQDWQIKVRAALDISSAETKSIFDDLLLIRRQIRNYMAHGAFGKHGEAFLFHSAAGAVPVMLTENERYSIWEEPMFDETFALQRAEAFIEHLWSGDLAPAKIHIQDASLPTILPYASDGTYARAMSSVGEMEDFTEYLSRRMDDAANMDF